MYTQQRMRAQSAASLATAVTHSDAISAAQERDLPPLPLAFSSKTRVPVYPRSPATARARVVSSLLPTYTPRSLAVVAFQHPRILAQILRSISWSRFYGLTSTCKSLRKILYFPDLRDVVLGQYVPGYADAVRIRNADRFHGIPITLHDLSLLLISLRVPLRGYPAHALATLNALYPSDEQEQTTRKFIAISQAHSRFVLLLQAMVHSSATPPPLEPAPIKLRSRSQPSRDTSFAGLRELTFPAPLSIDAPPTIPVAATVPRVSSESSPPPTRHRKLLSSSRKSVFGSSVPKMPPPAPRALVSDTWRRHTRSLSRTVTSASLSDDELHPPRRLGPMSRASGSSDSSLNQGPPSSFNSPSHRRFASAQGDARSSYFTGSSESLNPVAPSPLFWNQTKRRGSMPSMNESIPSRNGSPNGSSSPSVRDLSFLMARGSPHDVSAATSRSRAPVLRVFWPCARLGQGSAKDSGAQIGIDAITACEEQLAEAGLWEYLSVGDVVCNMGFVPPTTPSSSSSSGVLDPTDGPSSAPLDMDGADARQKWLLFTGQEHGLVVFTPPQPPPLEDVLTLPSPFYYVHLLASSNINPQLTLRIPRCQGAPVLTLVHTAAKVRSPHSPSGYAVVRRFCWNATARFPGSNGDHIGDGWKGECVLEGDGTREGKEMLIACFNGQEGRKQWELVREKSGGNRIWLKLVCSIDNEDSPTDSDHSQLW